MDNTLIPLRGRKRQKPTKLGHFSVTAPRGRTPAKPATVNRMRLHPQSIAKSETLRRAPAYVWFGRVTDGMPRPEWRPNECPFDTTCRHRLQTSNVESAHVRRTLLTAVGSGGDTSLASLYFSCQCAGLEGNLLRFASFRDKRSGQSGPAVRSNAKLRESQKRWSATPIPKES